MASTLTKKVADWFSPVQDALAEVKKVDADIRAEVSALLGERQTLLTAKPAKAVLLAGLPDAIAARGATWLRANAEVIVGALAGRIDVSPSGEVMGTLPGSLENVATMPITFDLLCACVPDHVKVALTTAISTASYLEGRPALADVPRRLAEVGGKIADAEARHRDLVDKAAEVGLIVEDLPSNRGRRVAAVRAAEAARKLDLLSRLDKGPRASRERAWNEARLEEHQQQP